MKFLTTYVHDVYHQSVVLKLFAILFHNWHIFILFLKFPLSAVRNSKYHIAQEPIKLLDFTFRTARENSQNYNKSSYMYLCARIFLLCNAENRIGPRSWRQRDHFLPTPTALVVHCRHHRIRPRNDNRCCHSDERMTSLNSYYPQTCMDSKILRRDQSLRHI